MLLCSPGQTVLPGGLTSFFFFGLDMLAGDAVVEDDPTSRGKGGV